MVAAERAPRQKATQPQEAKSSISSLWRPAEGTPGNWGECGGACNSHVRAGSDHDVICTRCKRGVRGCVRIGQGPFVHSIDYNRHCVIAEIVELSGYRCGRSNRTIVAIHCYGYGCCRYGKPDEEWGIFLVA